MSVREYVGARYTPLFMGAWDSTIEYEPLCVVQYQGNSFTSRQVVPAGTSIDNAEYWLESGNYNAQIEAYRNEVLAFDGRIEQNANDLAREIETRKNQYVELKDQTIADTLYGHILTRDARDVSYLFSDPIPPTWNGIQGCCMTKDGRYVALMSPGIEYYRLYETEYQNTCIIIEFGANGREIRRSGPILCGHGNQLAYNAKANQFVIADNYYLQIEDGQVSRRNASPTITIVDYDNLQKLSTRSYPQIGTTVTGVSYNAASETLMLFNGDDFTAIYLDPLTYEYIPGVVSLEAFRNIYTETAAQFDASRRQTQTHTADYIVMGFYMPNMWAFVKRDDPSKLLKIVHCYDFHDGEVEGFDIDDDGNMIFAMHKRYYNRHTDSDTGLIDQEYCTNIYTVYGTNLFINSWDSEWVEGSAVSAQRWIDVDPNTINVIQNGSVNCPCKTIMEAFWLATTREANTPLDIRIQGTATGTVGIARFTDYYGRLQDNSSGNVRWANNFRITNSKCDMLNINWVNIENDNSLVPYPFSSYSDVSINQSVVTLMNCTLGEGLRDVFIDESVAIINNDETQLPYRSYRNSIISPSGE